MCFKVIYRLQWAVCEKYKFDRIDALQCEQIKNNKLINGDVSPVML